MTPADLLALAARCEAAKGPDRALDAEIVVTAIPRYRGWIANRPSPGVIYSDHEPFISARFCTASLDAAASLVPEGWSWRIASYGEAATYENETGNSTEACAATPALALCAAALRAMAREMEARDA